MTNNTFIQTFLFIVYTATHSLGFCSDQDILTKDALRKIVLDNHPLIKASEEEIRQSKGEYLGTQGAFDPVLRAESNTFLAGGYSGSYQNLTVEKPLELFGSKLFAGYRRSGGEFPVYDDYFNTNNDGEVRAGIEIPLLRDGPIDRRRAAIARASIEIEVASLSLEQKKLELLRQSFLSYWNWIAAFHKKEAYSLLLKKAEERDRQIEQRVKVGDLAQFDKIDNQRQVLQRRSQLIAAERYLKQVQYDLELFLWEDDGTPISLDGKSFSHSFQKPKHPSRNHDDAITNALKNRIEHRRIKNQIEQQVIEAKLADNQILPRLDLSSYTSNDYGAGSSERAEGEVRTLVRLEIPLMTRTQRGKIEEIKAKQRALASQLEFIKQRISRDVLDSHNAFTLALERARLANEELNVSQELEKGEIMRFQQGESNLIFVNLREQTTLDARIREIDAIADSWKGHVLLTTAQGLFEE